MRHCVVSEYQAVYKRLIEGAEAEKIHALTTNVALTYIARQSDFRSIPGQPIAYWISERMRQCFQAGTPLGEIAPAKVGQNTGDNARFLRRWYEVTFSKIAFGITNGAHAIASRQKWFPYNKGGEFRRWYGNCEYLGSSPSLRPSAKARHTKLRCAFACCVHFVDRMPSAGSA